MKLGWIPFCRRISFSFFCQHMHQHCVIQPLCLQKSALYLPDIMAIHRSQISNPHIFEKHSGNKQLLDAVFRPLDPVNHLLAPGDPLQGSGNILFQVIVAVTGAQTV